MVLDLDLKGYTIVPTTIHPGEEAPFVLSVFTKASTIPNHSNVSESWLNVAVKKLSMPNSPTLLLTVIERGERMACHLRMDEASCLILGSPWFLNVISSWVLEVSKANRRNMEVALEGTSIHDIVHQNSTCGATENVGIAAKPNGIMHQPPSNMGLRQTINGRIIKKEPVYGGNYLFSFSPHGSYLDSRSAMGDASISSFSSVESNTQPLNEPHLDADTTSFGFLVEMPQNFGFSDLTADFTNSSGGIKRLTNASENLRYTNFSGVAHALDLQHDDCRCKKSPCIEMMKNNFFFFRSSTNDANKTPSPPLKSKEVSSWRSVSLSFGSFYDSGSGKKNFTDLRKSPLGHSKKVHPKKSGHDLSQDLSTPMLIQTIRRLTKEKHITSRTRFTDTRLEIEKNELQSILEKELDRRSSDWSLKLEKCQIEQHRLHERARELAEQNVSLQREISSFNLKIVDNRIKMSFSEKHLEDLSKRIEQVSEENQNLRQQLTLLQAEYRVAQDNRDYVWKTIWKRLKSLNRKLC
ncbi:hypothetical protein CQW23_13433 [Capsicum baccatum]|uniref:Uncharacterized protein n=1 Tax=Capsicum baccatum TaxID=33114 RepID=A0A2G2WVF9_CAPBA|nr:hypothetical protein CQW23_13433 [Capsicum baccatum]